MKAMHRFRILRLVKLSDKQKMFLDFKKWVKSIQTGCYNGTHTLFMLLDFSLFKFIGFVVKQMDTHKASVITHLWAEKNILVWCHLAVEVCPFA